MGLVRISAALERDVTQEVDCFASKIYEQTIKPLLGEYMELTVSDDAKVLELERHLWKENAHLLDTLPKEFIGFAQPLRLSVKINDKYDVTLNVSGKSSGKFRMPWHVNSYGSHGERYVASRPVQWVEEFKRQYLVYAGANEAHNAKFELIKRQIITFLKSSKSLNDALKKYPELRMHIPEEYLTQHDEVVVRVPREKRVADEKAEALAPLDTDALTSIGVLKQLIKT